MKTTQIVKDILANYESDAPVIKSKLHQILMHGKLAGSGKMVILPVDQGFEHGPARSFAQNPDSYDPHYHFKLAIEAGLNAYAAPLGFLEAGADSFAGQIPLILKLNSSNSLVPKSSSPDQAITGSVKDAVRLGCVAIGMTIYPGSDKAFSMIEEAKEIIAEAKSAGLAAVIWSYARGGDLKKEGETAIDVCAYGAHMAALLGAHIIKVKPPTKHVAQAEAMEIYQGEKNTISVETSEQQIKHIVQSCFNGRRLVVFSGGAAKSEDDIYTEVKAIKNGGGSGSIMGRNSFQRPFSDAISLLDNICKIYQ